MSASLNVACTIAGLEDAVVVTEELIPLVEKHGWRKIDDLRGRYAGQSDARIDQDAYDRCWARCTKDSIMLLGGHAGAVRPPAVADWGIRQRMFFHDLSANPKHPEEVALAKRLLSELTPGFKFVNNHRVARLMAGPKVYLSFVQSDSIGIGVWTKPGRGKLPLARQVTMNWTKFSPAALEYFHESATRTN